MPHLTRVLFTYQTKQRLYFYEKNCLYSSKTQSFHRPFYRHNVTYKEHCCLLMFSNIPMILRQLFKIILSLPIPHHIHLKFSQILPPQTHQLFKCWGYLRDGFLVPSSCLVLLTCFIGVINISMEIFRLFTKACSLTTL